MKRILLASLFTLLSIQPVYALIGIGGYAPGPSSQKSTDGSKNTFSFDPFLSINGVFKFMGKNIFVPEAGVVIHGSQQDGYNKQTYFILLDIGYLLTSKVLLRYGVGTFITAIGGDGSIVAQRNGAGTDDFFQPTETSASYNTTLDLGLEYGITQKYSLRLEGYFFEILSGEKRSMTYSLSLNYFL
jgi:hypothetical protein